MSRRPALVILGAGRVGRAMARGLLEARWPVRAIVCRRRRPTLSRQLGIPVGPDRGALGAAGAWLLAVPSGALPELAARLCSDLPSGGSLVALHTSGGAPGDPLSALRRAGAQTGRLHPLLPFPGGRGDAPRLRGAWFGLEGSPAARALARRLIAALGGNPLLLPPGAETGYHLSAVLGANLLVALAAGAAGLGPAWGSSRARALRALLPLLRATLDALESRGLPDALTGPAARGEEAAIARQLEWLAARRDPDLEGAYRFLSRLAVRLAQEAGRLSPEQARRLLRRLDPGTATSRRTS